MPLLDEIRAAKLIELAHARFDLKLSDAELKVLRDSASSQDLPDPGENALRPEVRAEFLRWLASDAEAAPHIDPKGLRVYGATIPGDLDLQGCNVLASMFFSRCTFHGEIILLSAETRGVFILGSSLAEGVSADWVTVHGPLFLRRVHSGGSIELIGAEIDAELVCSGVKLNAKGIALAANGARIGGGVFLNQGFESEGEIRLLGAEIAGNLDCSGAKLSVMGDALSADYATISGNVFLRHSFESKGEVGLSGATIGGSLAIRGAKVARVACQNTVIAGDLLWQGIENPSAATLILTGAKVKNLRDDRESWPKAGCLRLDGLVYEELTLHRRPSPEEIESHGLTEELGIRVKDRIDWLMRQPGHMLSEAQPWMLLSKHLEGKGDRNGAKHIVFKYRCVLAHARRKSWILRRLAIAFAWLEEVPLRIGYSIAFTLLSGWFIFGIAGSNGLLAPTDREADKAFRANAELPAGYPELNTLAYTFENAVPLVKLGQDEKWAPDRSWFAKESSTGYWLLVCARWALILSGWFQGAVLGAALLVRFKE